MCRDIINKLENKSQYYISDIIKQQDIDLWSSDEIVFIEAPTGRGKSHFIKHTLSEYQPNKRILLLVNRKIIKNQSEKELLKVDVGNITITTYQNLANKILQKKVSEFNGYDYIICDESHFFTEESTFIFTTDVPFDWIMEQHCVKIFMTATAYFIRNYLIQELKLDIRHYYIKNKYDFIEQLYFYTDDDVIKKLLLELPVNEKAIYFTSAKKAYEMSELLKSCVFYCSENNFSYNQYIDPKTIECIEENEMFEEQVLCTTKVMDAGVNIKDKSVKHIIIDIADLTSLIQCIGRKRIIDNDEKIILYIKDKKGNAISRKIEHIENKLKYADILLTEGTVKLIEENAHKNTYGNLIYDIINPVTLQLDKKVNALMYYTYNKDKEIYTEMLNNKYDGFKLKLFERMNINMAYKYLEDELDSLKLEDILNKFVGVKMFTEEQEQFKNFLTKELFNTAKTNHGSIGLKTINSYFEENEIPFIIESKRGSERINGKVKSFRYWIICKKVYENK